MQNISKEFTYNIADDQYYQTDELKKTATVTYVGPEKQYVVVNSSTNKLTGSIITQEMFETYNDTNTEFYAVEVDCNSNPLICSLVDKGIDEDLYPNISEEIPGCDIPYVRDNPVMPDHTYERTEIEYDRSGQTFITPFPWKKPFVNWKDKLSWRNIQLAASDKHLSEDLPTNLYNSMLEYRQYLRDFPATFGATFSITIATAGSGYSIGDRFLINDPSYKNGQPAADILVTVVSVNDTGGVTSITKTDTSAYSYHPNAGTYNNVFYVTSSTGTGVSFNMSKVKTIDPWKITPKESPIN